jgi:hypothetical protein
MKNDNEPPPKDSLAKLAEFTKRILQVPRSELTTKDASVLTPTIEEEPCQGT